MGARGVQASWRWWNCWAILAIQVFALPTRAQDASNQDVAQQLFLRGRALMKEAHYDQACVAFEQSLRTELAIGTLLNLGLCYELRLLPDRAAVHYGEAAALSGEKGDQARETLARERLAELAATYPSLVIVPPIDPAVVESVSLDGRPLTPTELSRKILVVPGNHVVQVVFDDGVTHSVGVAMPEPESGASPQVVSVALVRPSQPEDMATTRAGDVRRPVEPAGQAGPAVKVRRYPVVSTRDGHVSQVDHTPILPWVGLGLGLGVLGAGTGLAVDAFLRASRADCDANLLCSAEGITLRTSARDELAWGYGIGAAGLVLAGASGFFLLSDETKSSGQAHIRPVPGGLRASYSWRF